eukprot:13243880-Heterocapsa_arctica.AAC.1
MRIQEEKRSPSPCGELPRRGRATRAQVQGPFGWWKDSKPKKEWRRPRLRWQKSQCLKNTFLRTQSLRGRSATRRG